MTIEKTTDPATLQTMVRRCYMVILGNVVWLLLPSAGMLSGNNLNFIAAALIVAGTVLMLSNNYLAKRWYYYSDWSNGTVYKSHWDNIDHIGFITFFVTMIGGLLFLIVSVFVTNVLKSNAGFYVMLALNLALSGVLIFQAFWVLKRAMAGLGRASKSEAYA